MLSHGRRRMASLTAHGSRVVQANRTQSNASSLLKRAHSRPSKSSQRLLGRRTFTSITGRARSRHFLLGGAFVAPVGFYGLYLYPPLSPQLVKNHESVISRCEPTNTFLSLLALNSIVFLLWQPVFHAARGSSATLTKLTHFLNEHFMIYPQNFTSWKRWHTALTSVFSHQTASHIAANMFMLWILGSTIERFGKESFLAIYIGGGILGNLGQALWDRTVARTTHPICGSSGGATAILGAFFYWVPGPDIPIGFLGDGVVMPKQAAFVMIMFYDVVGTLMGWQKCAHVAHLTGILFGIAAMSYLGRTIGTTQEGEMIFFDGVYKGPIKDFHPTGEDGILHRDDGDYTIQLHSGGLKHTRHRISLEAEK